MKSLYNVIKTIFNRFSEDNVTVYSAYASFYMVISFVPFLIMVLMIASHFITFTSEDFVLFAGHNLPKSVIDFIVHMIDGFLSANTQSISISVIALLWTASRSVVAIAKGLDIVYKAEKPRSFIKINVYGIFYTFMFLVMIMSSLLVLVFGNIIANLVGNMFPFTINIIEILLSWRPLVTIVTLTLFFSCIYTFIPGKKLKFKNQLPGAVFSAAGWMIFSFLFSIYFDNFSDKSYIYGSLTALILLMLWIYFCIVIIFIGGEINYYLSNNRKEEIL